MNIKKNHFKLERVRIIKLANYKGPGLMQWMDDEGLKLLSDCVSSNSSTLEELELNFPHESWSPELLVKFLTTLASGFNRLCKLKLSLGCVQSNEIVLQPILKAISANLHNLKYLDLDFSPYVHYLENTTQEVEKAFKSCKFDLNSLILRLERYGEENKLKPLENLLLIVPSKFPNLKELSIQIQSQVYGKNFLEAFKKCIQSGLSNLVSLILNFGKSSERNEIDFNSLLEAIGENLKQLNKLSFDYCSSKEVPASVSEKLVEVIKRDLNSLTFLELNVNKHFSDRALQDLVAALEKHSNSLEYIGLYLYNTKDLTVEGFRPLINVFTKKFEKLTYLHLNCPESLKEATTPDEYMEGLLSSFGSKCANLKTMNLGLQYSFDPNKALKNLTKNLKGLQKLEELNISIHKAKGKIALDDECLKSLLDLVNNELKNFKYLEFKIPLVWKDNSRAVKKLYDETEKKFTKPNEEKYTDFM